VRVPGVRVALEVLLAAVDLAPLGAGRHARLLRVRTLNLVVAFDEDLGLRSRRAPAAPEAVGRPLFHPEVVAVVEHAGAAGDVLVEGEADEPLLRLAPLLGDPGDVLRQRVPAGRAFLALLEVALDEVRPLLPAILDVRVGRDHLRGLAVAQAIQSLLDIDVRDFADRLGPRLLLVDHLRRLRGEVGDVDPKIVNVGVIAGDALHFAPDADVAALPLADDLLHLLQRGIGGGERFRALAPVAHVLHRLGEDEAALALQLLPEHVAEGASVAAVVELRLEIEGDNGLLRLAGLDDGREGQAAQDGGCECVAHGGYLRTES